MISDDLHADAVGLRKNLQKMEDSRLEEALIAKMSEQMIAGKLEELMLAKMTEKMRAGNSEEALVARMSELDQQIANLKKEMLLEEQMDFDDEYVLDDYDMGDDAEDNLKFTPSFCTSNEEKMKFEQGKNSITLKDGVIHFNKPVRTLNSEKKQRSSLKHPKRQWTKPKYKTNESLPIGWTYFDNGKGQTFFRDEKGRFIKNRRHALAKMVKANDGNASDKRFTEEEISFIRDGLVEEGWSYADPRERLPHGWLYKKYRHSIEGVDTDVLYLIAPDGNIIRSKAKLKRNYKDHGLSETDVMKLLDFKPEGFQGPEDVKRLDNPDDQWVYDPDIVPEGWMVKRYTFNSSLSQKVDEVFHYLTPCRQIVRGKKQVFDYMSRTSTFSAEAFNKFPFNKTSSTASSAIWEEWEDAEDLPAGWKVRSGSFQAQRKKQYKSPVNEVFQSRIQVERFLKATTEGLAFSLPKRRRGLSSDLKGDEESIVWAEWRSDDIPCLPGGWFVNVIVCFCCLCQ